jgi:hypothetical protein
MANLHRYIHLARPGILVAFTVKANLFNPATVEPEREDFALRYSSG